MLACSLAGKQLSQSRYRHQPKLRNSRQNWNLHQDADRSIPLAGRK